MLAFHFGPSDRRLFGLFHPALTNTPVRRAVLLCNPFGQEAVRVHRMYRVLAERLARSGTSVLRFDGYGTGDSAGDDTEGDLQGWVSDLIAAGRELEQRATPGRVVWLGARLGATLVALAAVRAPRPPDELVLWEPVVDGAAYLNMLAHGTVAAFESSFSIADPAWRRALASEPATLEHEAIGFEMGPLLHAQLTALTPASFAPPRVRRVTVVSDAASPASDAVLQRWRGAGLTVDETLQPHEFDWLAEEALNSALVPNEIVARLAQLAGTSP